MFSSTYTDLSREQFAVLGIWRKARFIRRSIGWKSAACCARNGALSDNNRRAKYYRLTAAGRRELETEAVYWDRVAAAVTRVMQMA
jgi:hypothetical protein